MWGIRYIHLLPWLTTLLCLPSTLLSSSFQKVDHQNELLIYIVFLFHMIIFILLQFEEFCNLSWFRVCRCNGSYVHIREQMRLHCLAWNSRLSKAGQHRLWTSKGRFPFFPSTDRLVRSLLGQNRLQLRQLRPRLLRHCRLRLQPSRMQRSRRSPACHLGRIHPRLRFTRLLRRQPRRRL